MVWAAGKCSREQDGEVHETPGVCTRFAGDWTGAGWSATSATAVPDITDRISEALGGTVLPKRRGR